MGVSTPMTKTDAPGEDAPRTAAPARFLASGDEAGTAPEDRAFRPDVEGLRAVAVLLVVLYHVGIPHLGGYVGVDVFFVISGYVITGLLLRERSATGRTSLLAFYGRRSRRIIPAAALVIVVTVLASRRPARGHHHRAGRERRPLGVGVPGQRPFRRHRDQLLLVPGPPVSAAELLVPGGGGAVLHRLPHDLSRARRRRAPAVAAGQARRVPQPWWWWARSSGRSSRPPPTPHRPTSHRSPGPGSWRSAHWWRWAPGCCARLPPPRRGRHDLGRTGRHRGSRPQLHQHDAVSRLMGGATRGGHGSRHRRRDRRPPPRRRARLVADALSLDGALVVLAVPVALADPDDRRAVRGKAHPSRGRQPLAGHPGPGLVGDHVLLRREPDPPRPRAHPGAVGQRGDGGGRDGLVPRHRHPGRPDATAATTAGHVLSRIGCCPRRRRPRCCGPSTRPAS